MKTEKRGVREERRVNREEDNKRQNTLAKEEEEGEQNEKKVHKEGGSVKDRGKRCL